MQTNNFRFHSKEPTDGRQLALSLLERVKQNVMTKYRLTNNFLCRRHLSLSSRLIETNSSYWQAKRQPISCTANINLRKNMCVKSISTSSFSLSLSLHLFQGGDMRGYFSKRMSNTFKLFQNIQRNKMLQTTTRREKNKEQLERITLTGKRKITKNQY